MLQYGAVKIDLDFESLKPIEGPCWSSIGIHEPNHHTPIQHPKCLYGISAWANFWQYVIKHILRNYEGGQVDQGDPLGILGPVML